MSNLAASDYNAAVNQHSSTSRDPASGLRSPLVLGTTLGLVSAVAYTATHIFLRSVTHCDPVWVGFVKAAPTALILAPWAVTSAFPVGRGLVSLLAAGLVGQLGGNILFQWALGVLGISLTIPLCIGSMILSSAILGRLVLGEAITWRTWLSMATLVAAIWVLSFGVTDGGPAAAPSSTPLLLSLGVAGGCLSGVAYAILGVVIRRTVTGRASVATTTWVVAVVGVVSLGAVCLARQGLSPLWLTTVGEWQRLVLAGSCNFIAFVSLAKALQLTTLVYVNALNASQVALGAVAGLLLFAEAPSMALLIGVSLTVLGLLNMPKSGARRIQRPKETSVDSRVRNASCFSSSADSSESSQVEKAAQVAADNGRATSHIASESTLDCEGE